MDFAKFFNINFKSLLKEDYYNYRVEDLLKEYDGGNQRLSEKEISIFFDNCASKKMKFGMFLFGKKRIINEIYKTLDGKNDGIKDGEISYDELNMELNKYKIDILNHLGRGFDSLDFYKVVR